MERRASLMLFVLVLLSILCRHLIVHNIMSAFHILPYTDDCFYTAICKVTSVTLDGENITFIVWIVVDRICVSFHLPGIDDISIHCRLQ